MATDPRDVWRIVEQADEAVKYGRDPTALERARAALDEAERALAGVEPVAAGKLEALIRLRREDLARMEEGTGDAAPAEGA